MSGLLRRPPAAKEIAEVNVVPLADVSLVLLIILLVLSPMLTQARLQVHAAGKAAPSSLPEPPGEEPPAPSEPVLAVALGPAGLAVGERVFTDAAAFRSFLSSELAARADRKVFLAPSPDTPHGEVVRALQLIKTAGASSIALVQTADEESHGALPAPAPAR